MLVAALVAMVMAVGVGISLTPIFEAEQVLVRGTAHLRPEQVRRISGLVIGTNVLHADLAASVAQLERSGWIAEATAERELPNILIIEIRERLPVGRTLGDQAAVVMGDGTVVEGVRLPRLPRIWIRGPGSGAEASVAKLAAALGALSSGVRAQVVGATMRPDGVLILQLRDGVGVVFGPPIEVTQKARVLEEMLRWAMHQGLRLGSVDVTVPQAPTARTSDDIMLEL